MILSGLKIAVAILGATPIKKCVRPAVDHLIAPAAYADVIYPPSLVAQPSPLGFTLTHGHGSTKVISGLKLVYVMLGRLKCFLKIEPRLRLAEEGIRSESHGSCVSVVSFTLKSQRKMRLGDGRIGHHE